VQPPVDFESRQRALQRWTVILATVFYFGAFALCRSAYGTTLGFAVSSPVLGVYFSWWLLHRGAGGGLRWARWMALRSVDGRYHAFQDCPVSILWRAGQCVVLAQDAFRVVNLTVDEQTLRRLATRFGETQFFQDEGGQWWFGETAVLVWLDRHTVLTHHVTWQTKNVTCWRQVPQIVDKRPVFRPIWAGTDLVY